MGKKMLSGVRLLAQHAVLSLNLNLYNKPASSRKLLFIVESFYETTAAFNDLALISKLIDRVPFLIAVLFTSVLYK